MNRQLLSQSWRTIALLLIFLIGLGGIFLPINPIRGAESAETLLFLPIVLKGTPEVSATPTTTSTPEAEATLTTTSTPEAGATATSTPEMGATATSTPEMGATATTTSTPEGRPTNTMTATPRASGTATATARASFTPTIAGSATPTSSPSITSSPSATSLSSSTPTPTLTPISEASPTITGSATVTSSPTATSSPTTTSSPTPSAPEPLRIVFVSRQIQDRGSDYYTPAKDMPGVGPYSRFRLSAPGKLLIREPNGTLTTLIDGSNPTAATFNLIDVNAPDVSYDGTKIVFAGLSEDEEYNPTINPLNNPDAWRLYTINVDGTGLEQVTFSDQDDLDLSQFGDLAQIFSSYDDTDPIWLPDGRIAFISTRWPAFGQYSGARTSNLYVVNADGSNLRRITAERSGADRPMVDPITGKIVFFRWWRNVRHAKDDMATIEYNGGYLQKDGLTLRQNDPVGGDKNLQRNSWHIATVNPDGTGLSMWGGVSNTFGAGTIVNHTYGGGFAPDGTLYANFFPMYNMTEAAGFGGIRRYNRGFSDYEPIIGITDPDGDLVSESPPSFGIYVGPYAGEPEVLNDGRVIISWAADINQDYGLYLINADGSNRQLLYDNPGTTELRARLIRTRALPPIIPDSVTDVASQLPPLAEGPYDTDGTFTFRVLNVYFNAPVDTDVVSAPPVGSAGTIRFFIDHQRTNPGSFEHLDWPILLDELTIAPDGSVTNFNAPANVPLFEQIRSPQPDYAVPLTGRTTPMSGPSHRGGAAHVAGLNFGRPGEVATCVGCHTGHTLIPVPADAEEAKFSNVAPSAEITTSSTHPQNENENVGLLDRQVMKGLTWDYWRSAPDQDANSQWVEFTFPVPITVRTVRLYNPRFGDQANSTLQVHSATVRLYSDEAGTIEVASQDVNQDLSVAGTDVAFNEVLARVVRVEITNVSGTFYDQLVASLAEIEVIARGEAE